MNLRFIFLGILFLIAAISAFSQAKQLKDIYKEANQLFKKGKYEEALKYYLKVEHKKSVVVGDEDLINYRIGFCYYNTKNQKELAIPYFESYLKNDDEFFEAWYLLGKLYQHLYKYDEAINNFEKFKIQILSDTIAPEKLTKQLAEKIDKEIERCNFGKILTLSPVDLVVENLGEQMNTPYNEYAPVVNPDESVLIFTKRSPETTGGKISFDGDYFEDIYISRIEEGSLFGKDSRDKKDKSGFIPIITPFKFSRPQGMGPAINTKGHEGAIQFSNDGKKLYIYHNSQVLVSELVNGSWQQTKEITGLKGILLKGVFEPSVSIAPEGDIIFFSSERKGGFGGLDIYLSSKQKDGSWGLPANLGPAINTPFDEDAPYIDPDGHTLYFSSNGHSSIGGYDVFKSSFDGIEWFSPPHNMGFPINSAGDDIFFTMTPEFNRAYYSSNKPGGYGGMDIYRLTFASERPPVAEIKGFILSGDSLVPAYSVITVFDVKQEVELSKHYSDSLTGRYHLIFPYGHSYKVRVETEGFVPYIKQFDIPKEIQYYYYYQEIHHVHIKDKTGKIIGQKVTLHTAIVDPVAPPAKADSVSAASSTPSAAQTDFAQKQLLLLPSDTLPGNNFKRDSTVILPVSSMETNSLNMEKQVTISAENGFDTLHKGTQAKFTSHTLLNQSPAASLPFISISDETVILTDSLYEDGFSNQTISSEKISLIESVDIKYYWPRDTIIKLMAQDSTVNIELTQKSSISFFEPKDTSSSIMDTEAYIPLEKPIEKIKLRQPLILGSDSTKKVDELKMSGDYSARLFSRFVNDTASMDVAKTFFEENKQEQIKLSDILKPIELKTNSKESTLINTIPKSINKETAFEAKNIIIKETGDTSSLSAFFETAEDSMPNIIILFDFNSNNLPKNELIKLDAMANFMVKHPTLKFEIRGHTDSKGADEFNRILSLKRGGAVRNYLVGKKVNPNRLVVSGAGEGEPIAPNSYPDGTDNPAGRNMNRRVEFKLKSPKP